MLKQFSLILIQFILLIGPTFSQNKNDAPLSENAPEDKPHTLYFSQMKKLDSLMAPYVAQAKVTLPNAKSRFASGLPAGEAFFITTRIFDKDGKFEQVFVRVLDYSNDKIKGNIASELSVVKEYSAGQLINVKENDVLDWLISKPDGSEEGNFVGKFLDTQ